MGRRQRRKTTLGVLLIIIGAWFLAVEFYEPLGNWADTFAEWPTWIIATGALILLFGFIGGVPDMAIPAAIISGVGGILLYQNATNEWGTWAYAWALIPGFVGVGIFISNLLKGNFKRALREGGGRAISSLFVFVVLGALFHPSVGGPQFLSELSSFWPLLLILVGLRILFGRGIKIKRAPQVDVV